MQDKDDQQWLEALAGQPDAAADPATTTQAQALRAAMVARRAAIEHTAQHADPAEFGRLQARLQGEGLLHDSAAKQQPGGWLQAMRDVWRPIVGGSVTLPRWGVAFTVVLGVALALQVALPGRQEDADVLRGGTATVLVVADPEARLAELTLGLNQVKAMYAIDRLDNGVIQIRLKADAQALTFLQSQRISPTIQNGLAVIALRTVKP